MDAAAPSGAAKRKAQAKQQALCAVPPRPQARAPAREARRAPMGAGAAAAPAGAARRARPAVEPPRKRARADL
eukprot:2196303-Alexandrium_andersonii.AAC.1